jgi:hypothetical protein
VQAQKARQSKSGEAKTSHARIGSTENGQNEGGKNFFLRQKKDLVKRGCFTQHKTQNASKFD